MYFIIIHSRYYVYFLSINIIFNKETKNVCYITVCYCELKLKKMMLLHGLNENIIITHLSYSGMCQYEAKMRALQRYEYFWVVTPPPPHDQTVLHMSP